MLDAQARSPAHVRSQHQAPSAESPPRLRHPAIFTDHVAMELADAEMKEHIRAARACCAAQLGSDVSAARPKFPNDHLQGGSSDQLNCSRVFDPTHRRPRWDWAETQ